MDNELKEVYMEMYTVISEVKAFYDITMAVLRDNDGKEPKTDIFPVACILDEKILNLYRKSDYLLWILHDRELI